MCVWDSISLREEVYIFLKEEDSVCFKGRILSPLGRGCQSLSWRCLSPLREESLSFREEVYISFREGVHIFLKEEES